MSKPVIQIENISKLYQLGEVGTGTLSHDLTRAWAKLCGKPDPFAKIGLVNDREQSGGDFVWALKDINLEIKEGENLGIIGRNGAGKSSLLKLLSRVTAPTTGVIRTRGRIASLLEVGTGFHLELTGRENIYLNGTIMGMSRQEITARLEEIVEFSGCAKYIDTPVKRYSTGMLVRLGFSVAAHLECDILVVDEVLAVGDADFQRKSIKKLEDKNNSDGKTVLFVSHNLAQIQNLCHRGVVLTQGKVSFDGDIKSAIQSYAYGTTNLNPEIDLTTYPCAKNIMPGFEFKSLEFMNSQHEFYEKDSLKLKINYELYQTFSEAHIGITLSDYNQTVVECRSTANDQQHFFSKLGLNSVEVIIPLRLKHGTYTLNLGAVATKGLLAFIPNITRIEILPEKTLFESWKVPSAGLLITESHWKSV